MKTESTIAPTALLEAAAESILVTTPEIDYPGPTILYVNPAFERMTGWTQKDILGKSPRVLQGPKTDKTIFKDLKTRLRDRRFWEGQAVNYRKNGQEFIMEWSIAPVHDNNGAICQYVAVQRDVTKRVETEKQLKESREALISSLVKREHMREIFGKFVPSAIVDQILADSGQLDPDVREATILYSDIQGFSALTESMNPKTILEFVNEYFSTVTGLIESRGGVIQQFQGDAILATFNIPLKAAHHAINAVESALDILDKLNSRRFLEGIAVSTRIGINTGRVVAGTVGSAGRLGYTVHGDTVNLAAHIEQENKRYGTDILIAESTARKLDNRFTLNMVDTVAIKSRATPVTLYTIKR